MINGKKIVIVLPAYNAGQTLEITYKEIPFDIVDEVVTESPLPGFITPDQLPPTQGFRIEIGLVLRQSRKSRGTGIKRASGNSGELLVDPLGHIIQEKVVLDVVGSPEQMVLDHLGIPNGDVSGQSQPVISDGGPPVILGDEGLGHQDLHPGHVHIAVFGIETDGEFHPSQSDGQGIHGVVFNMPPVETDLEIPLLAKIPGNGLGAQVPTLKLLVGIEGDFRELESSLFASRNQPLVILRLQVGLGKGTVDVYTVHLVCGDWQNPKGPEEPPC